MSDHMSLPSELAAGDVVAVSGGKLHSRLIRSVTGSPYSHVAIVVALQPGSTGHSIWYVCEAMEPGGVRLLPLLSYLRDCRERGTPVAWYRIRPHAEVDRVKVVDFALAQIGKRYANLRQFRLSWGCITRGVRRLLGMRYRYDTDPERWFCSELVAASLHAGGARLPSARIAAEMSPADVLRLPCLAYGSHLRTRGR